MQAQIFPDGSRGKYPLATLGTATGAGLVGFLQTGTGSVLRTVQSKEEDVLSAEDKGAVADGVTDNQTAISNLFTDTRIANFGPGVYYMSSGDISPHNYQIVQGAGRENTFIRCGHATHPVFSTINQFIEYQNMTVDRPFAASPYGMGLWQSGASNSSPLEGFKSYRVNVSGHATGYYIRDFVLLSITDGYVQSCDIGIDIARTGSNYNTVCNLERLWIRACNTVGLQISGTVGGTFDQVTFDGASITMPLGADISDCGALKFTQSWWELLALGATIVNNRGLVEFDGGHCNGSSLTSEAFYVYGAGTPTSVVFSGAWDVSNMGGKTFAIADQGATIYVTSPQLMGFTFSAINGGTVIFEVAMEGKATWNPANCASLAKTASTTVTVPGAKLGDVCEVSFENGTSDPQNFLFKADCFADDTVTVSGFNFSAGALDLASGTLSVRVQKRALIS